MKHTTQGKQFMSNINLSIIVNSHIQIEYVRLNLKLYGSNASFNIYLGGTHIYLIGDNFTQSQDDSLI